MVSERVILHSDMNSFYASCEAAYNPKLQGKPIAVCGDPERRNGIVLYRFQPLFLRFTRFLYFIQQLTV